MSTDTNINTSNSSRVLVTGAGGPAAIAVLRSLGGDPSVVLVTADMDPWASGLYLTSARHRVLVPAGTAENFIDALLEQCRRHRINVLVPTVDAELEPIAAALDRFEAIGVQVLGAPADVLSLTLDKFELARKCVDVVRVPRTELVTETDPMMWEYPVIVKPRRGSGSRGVKIIESADDFSARGWHEDAMIQEFLPGEEYSIDVLATTDGVPLAAVPRMRVRVDSGIAVAGRTLNDPELEQFAFAVVACLRLPYISNVQVRRDREGHPALLEVNPRVPGSLALTIAAGVDMVCYALNELRGLPIPVILKHREVAMVRYLSDHVVELPDLMPEVWESGERGGSSE